MTGLDALTAVDGQPLTGEHVLADVERAVTAALDHADTRLPEDVPSWWENARRAARALDAVQHYARKRDRRAALETEPTEQYVRDLITDLRHLCELFTDDTSAFDALALRARHAYEAEQSR